MRSALAFVLVALGTTPATAAPLCADLGLAGLLAKCNRGETVALTLGSGQPLAAGPVTLQSGAYYEMTVTADGSAELGLAGPEFFHAVWLNEVVINDIEVRPLGLDSLEFDDEGEAKISFIAIKPGTYRLAVPRTTGESQAVMITIE